MSKLDDTVSILAELLQKITFKMFYYQSKYDELIRPQKLQNQTSF